MLTITDRHKDPWDVYEYLLETIAQKKLDSIFFFLLGDTSVHDRNLNYKNPLVKKLINSITPFSEIGIHPSYTTSSSPEKILRRKKGLKNYRVK